MRGDALVPTGIHGLDVQLGGGVPKGSLILLLGESTNAMYTFMEQFAASGNASGVPVHWIEMDRAGRAVLPGIERFSDKPAGEKLVVFEAFEPAVRAGASNGSGPVRALKPGEVASEAVKLVSEAGSSPFRMVVTSITALLDTMPAPECVAFLRQLAYATATSGGVVLVSLVAAAHPSDLVARIKHLATGVFEIGLERKGFGLYSFLKVEKLVGVPEATKLLLFSESEKGLTLESTRRVF